MDIGISSSCFYPKNVEDALKLVGESGTKTAEIFINSFSELDGPIMDELCSVKNYYGFEIRTLHPFSSSMETVMFFSPYERRLIDSIDFYKRFFCAAARLGAQAIVLHGGRTYGHSTPEVYAENYYKLHSAALKEGVYIAHENITNSHCGKPDFMKKVADYVGDDFKMVLDIKQCRREKVSEYDFIDLLGEKIFQVHISDFNESSDCLPPGEGQYDFGKLFDALQKKGYDSTAIIELYEKSYDNFQQIVNSEIYLENLLS